LHGTLRDVGAGLIVAIATRGAQLLMVLRAEPVALIATGIPGVVLLRRRSGCISSTGIPVK
jgi:hypothetical protein